MPEVDYNTVSFPGLGIAEMKINPTAIKISDNFTIEWYAIIICFGILVAFFVCDRLAKRFDIDSNDVLDALLIGLPSGFVGARVWYILGDLKNFDSFVDMISVWNGGLAIYGGVIGACIAGIIICKIKKISFMNMMDLVGIGFLIGQIIGRWGNFANVEVFGKPTDLPWRMGVGVDGIIDGGYVHPLFIYESLWNLLGLFIILAYMDSRKFKGEVFLMYVSWYGVGRAWMEPLRNSQYNLEGFGVMINMVLAIVTAVAAIGLIVLIRIKKPNRLMVVRMKTTPEVKYESQFDYAMAEQEDVDEMALVENEPVVEESIDSKEEENK